MRISYIRFILAFCITLILPGLLQAQRFMGVKVTTPTVCYAHTEDNPCIIPAPEEYLKRMAGARTKSSNIEVVYNPGFSPEAQAAFEYAIDIWESLIVSAVPIRIDAYWSPLNQSVLGGALYTSAYANFTGAQKLDVFYPVALAEKILGRNLNGNEPDIFIQFNNAANWNFNPAEAPGPGQFDLVTVVLHEIAHGLGFSGTFSSSATTGSFGLFGSAIPIVYDIPIENGGGFNLIRTTPSPSNALHSELTSNNLFFNSATSLRPNLFAPSTFSAGSSISHLDETTYNNSADALMTPNIAPAEKIHSPGIAWNMLKDLGWEMVRIVHTPLSDSESLNNPFTVNALLIADNGYSASSVKLHYQINNAPFVSVDMTPTGNPDEFSGIIPASGTPQTYRYYISVNDDAGREFVNPGKIVAPLNPETQFTFSFQTGPDLKAPIISHSPKPFLLESETTLTLDARVTDNIGIDFVTVEYLINDVTQSTQAMILQAPEEDSVYRAVLNLGTRANGDEIKYRIVARDLAVAQNESTSPEADYYVLNVVGLEPTQDSYANDFNTPSNDFFGNGFSITQPSGFSDPAIHSTHPYPEGNGFPNNELNFIYQLKIPIRVKPFDAIIRFDEIVLVEPGESGAVFGDLEFWDYVVVEGSKDGGITWTHILNGYDSRDYAPWLTRYNSSISGNNSTAIGDPSLYRQRIIDMLSRFVAGDEVVIRFRLYSDPFAAGWGWAIDNLKIQIDDTPPTLEHVHVDYLLTGSNALTLKTKVSDGSGVEKLSIDYRIDGGDVNEVDFVVFPPAPEYEFTLTGLNVLPDGTLIEYRINATDSAGNSTSLPSPATYFQVPFITLTSPVPTYANTFNNPTTDFAGNFFSISQPTGFTNGAIHSAHDYPLGFGVNNTSSFSYTLKNPITINSSNPYMRFDEIVIVEGHSPGVSFGSPGFKDYVIVEGSKDGGQTWSRFLDGYDLIGGDPLWANAFVNQGNGNASMFRTRQINLTANGNFQHGEQVLIRFRLFSDANVNGWGWAIDNLFIQDPVTGLELPHEGQISVYPNPALKSIINIEADQLPSQHYQVELLSNQGHNVYEGSAENNQDAFRHQIDLSGLPSGMMFLRLRGDRGDTIIRKIVN